MEKAVIFAHAAALKDKYALEEQELILRRKNEQLELDTEIAATTAKLAALQVRSSITSQHASVTSQQSDGMESYFRKAPAHLTQSACLKMHAEKSQHMMEIHCSSTHLLKRLSIEWKQRQAAKTTICTTLTRGQPRNIVY